LLMIVVLFFHQGIMGTKEWSWEWLYNKLTGNKKEIEEGRGIMYVKRDGTVYYFCSSKCEKNMLKLRRNPRKVKWVKIKE